MTPGAAVPTRGLAAVRRWLNGEETLVGVALTTGEEALWVPPGADPRLIWTAIRYFVGGLPDKGLQEASALIRGALEGVPEPDVATGRHLARAIDSKSQMVSISWEDGPPTITGTAEPGAFTGRLAPARVVRQETFRLGPATVHCVTSRSSCPEPLNEAPGCPIVRPVLDSVTAGCDVGSARSRAVSEALERYALGSIPRTRLREARAVDLDAPYLAPNTVASYSATQCERQDIKTFSVADTELWIDGRAMEMADERVWVPVSLALAPLPYAPSWEVRGLQNSSGSAYHSTEEAAVATGWSEVVERDAFLRCWRLRRPTPRALPLTSVPEVVSALLEWIKATCMHSKATALLLRDDPVPVWAVVAAGPTIGICIGCATGDGRAALTKAACESVCQILYPASPVVDAKAVASPADHAGYFRHGERYRAADWLFDLDDDTDPPWTGATVSPTGVVVSLKVPAGFKGHAVKVIDTDLWPMTFGFDAEPTARLSGPEDWNGLAVDQPLAPHPFA